MMKDKKLKVLHICTSDNGGAGLCCVRIHKALLEQGINSRVLFLRKTRTNDFGVYESKKYKLVFTFWRIFNRLLRIIHLDITDYNKVISLSKKINIACNIPTSIIDVTNHPLVKWADIIHLHWIDNFVDYPSFFEKIDKPIVWTQHDEGLFSGVYRFSDGKEFNSPLEDRFYPIKYKAVHNAKQLGIVFLSKMMYDRFHDDKMISGRKSTIINNPVDCKSFSPVDKKVARNKMNIPEDALVFSFVAYNIMDPRKGLVDLSKTIKRMKLKNAWIMAVGGTDGYKNLPYVHPVGRLNGPEDLSTAYSCADFFVMPSKKEAFAQTPIESMACGIPAIVYPFSGTDELITPINGIRTKGFTPKDLEEAITKALSTQYSSKAIRDDMTYRFSPEVIAKKYICFYNNMLKAQ